MARAHHIDTAATADEAAAWFVRLRDPALSEAERVAFADWLRQEPDRAAHKTDFWFGETIGHTDIAVAAALRFIGDAHPGSVSMADFPALAAHAKRCEALPVFQTIAQKFIPPA